MPSMHSAHLLLLQRLQVLVLRPGLLPLLFLLARKRNLLGGAAAGRLFER